MTSVVGTTRFILALIVIACLGGAMAFGQAAPAAQTAGPKPMMAEEAFKNVQVLRGIPVKEFMATMGFFAAALSMNCTDCHGDASASDWANYATDTPLKNMARRMVIMVNGINAANFGTRRMVTCYTCHRGTQTPKVIPSLDAQYGEPPAEDPDELFVLPGARPAFTAEQLLDKYIQAAGGAQALGRLTSYTAKGTYEGFDSDFSKVTADIYAKAPSQRSVVAHMASGDANTIYDGRSGWVSGPKDLVPVTLVDLVDADLLGARLDSLMSFPGQIKQVLTDMKVGFPPAEIDGSPADIVQGTLNGMLVKLYFDKQSGLLVRTTRFLPTAVGTVATRVEYSDYRAVGNTGVKLPYKIVVTWVDGQSTIELASITPNATVEASRFNKPVPPR